MSFSQWTGTGPRVDVARTDGTLRDPGLGVLSSGQPRPKFPNNFKCVLGRGGAQPSRGRPGRKKVPFLVAALMSTCGFAGCSISPPPPVAAWGSEGVLYLQSYQAGHTARIALNLAWGGAIVETSLDGTNFVNADGAGREVQPSLYDGADTYSYCCPGNWGWNPVLGGDEYNNGSPVVSFQVGASSLYVKTQPLLWNPVPYGGGAGAPVPANVYIEQTVSLVPNVPLAFLDHVVVTSFDTNMHYNYIQELPAVYTNGTYTNLAYYGGTAPWTNDTPTVTAAPMVPGTPHLYAPEGWEASVDANNQGLTVYVAGGYPYVQAATFPDSANCCGSSNDATNYLLQLATATIAPGSSFSVDIYLIPGDYRAARQGIYSLHQSLAPVDHQPPYGAIDAPAPVVQGSSALVSGWAFDNVAVASVAVTVDGNTVGTPALSVDRPDVTAAWPHAPLQSGWTLTFASSELAPGSHNLSARITDTSGNVAVLAPVTLQVTAPPSGGGNGN